MSAPASAAAPRELASSSIPKPPKDEWSSAPTETRPPAGPCGIPRVRPPKPRHVIEMKRRFGARSKPRAAPLASHNGSKPARSNVPVVTTRAPAARPPGTTASTNQPDDHRTPAPSAYAFHPTTASSPSAPAPTQTPAQSSTGTNPGSPHAPRVPAKAISRSTRRAVSERDGLRCAWQSADGVRCESRAWLENDHVDPRGRGGSSDPENVRLLCRAHNQRAAELCYGRGHIADAVTRARKRRERAPHSAPPPSA